MWSGVTARPVRTAPIVVDTSVVVKWFKTRDEELVDEARSLLNAVDARSLVVHVPAHRSRLFWDVPRGWAARRGSMHAGLS